MRLIQLKFERVFGAVVAGGAMPVGERQRISLEVGSQPFRLEASDIGALRQSDICGFVD